MMYVFASAISLLLAITDIATGDTTNRCCDQHYGQAERALRVSYEEVLVLGDDDADGNYLFGNPVAVVADSKGRIYVADNMSADVRVFEADGSFVDRIGRRGQGPGEYRSIAALYMDNQDRLYVLDNLNARVTTYGANRQLEATYSLPDIASLWPRLEKDSATGRFVLLYKVPSAVVTGGEIVDTDDPGYLLHVYDERFEDTGRAFGLFSEMWTQDEFTSLAATMSSGFFTLLPEGDLVYAPTLYNGNLYRFTTADISQQPVMRLVGRREPASHNLVHVARNGVVQRGEHSVETSVINSVFGNAAANVQRKSAGIFTDPDRRLILHFTSTKTEEGREMGVEAFDIDGTFKGYAPIPELPIYRNNAINAYYNIAWRDDSGRYYIIDKYRRLPQIRVARISVVDR